MKIINLLLFVSFFLNSNCENELNFDKLKKCCSKTQLYNSDTKKCQEDFSHLNFSNVSVLPQKYVETNSETTNSNPFRTLGSYQPELNTGIPDCSNTKEISLSLEDESGYFVTDDAKLISLSGVYERSADLGDFCLEIAASPSTGKSERIALVCDPCGKSDVTCIRSCCPHHKGLFNFDGVRCSPLPNQNVLNPPTWNLKLESDEDLIKNRDYFIIYDKNFKSCPANSHNPSGLFLLTPEEITFKIFENGTLKLNDSGYEQIQPLDSYCVHFGDVSDDKTTWKSEIFKYCVQHEDEICIACILYPICCTISNIFLLLTFAAFIMLPELRKPFLGKIIMAFIVALFLAFLCLSIVSFSGVKPARDGTGCKAMGFLTQFFFLVAYFWMNVIAFDIFQRIWFGNESMFSDLSIKQNFRVKFALYASYAIGIPALISITTIAVDLDPNISDESIFKPLVGSRKCFFDQDKDFAAFVFHYLPLLVIQVANLIFFFLTLAKLCRVRKLEKKTDGGITQNLYQHSVVVLKLFLIMGLTWLFEFLSFISNWLWDKEMSKNISYFTDVINLLQGVFIFIILICKQPVLENLKKIILRSNDTQILPNQSFTMDSN